MWAPIILSTLAIAIPFLIWKLLRKPRMSGPHPFRPLPTTGRSTAERYVYKWKERKALLRIPFTEDAAKEGGPYDAIVIGSGVGGLSAASLMAKMGKRILVLEQNNQLGGCTHTFNHKGYEFDVGIHYIGHMNSDHVNRFIIDQLTEGKLEWQELAPQFDTVVLGGGLDEDEKDAIFIPIGKSLRESESSILKQFPNEDKAIGDFFQMVREDSRLFNQFMIVKLLPLWLVRLLNGVGILSMLCRFFKRSQITLGDFLKKSTQNPGLRTTLSYCCGDYGVFPKDGSICMHATLWSHFSRGAYYPVGGSSEITLTLMQVIQSAGGKIFGKARVNEILCNENGRAIGVRLLRKAEKGANAETSAKGTIDLYAPLIISDAGVINTASMLPQHIRQKSRLPKAIDTLGAGFGAIQAFFGLRNTGEEIGLTTSNIWAFPFGKTMDIDEALNHLYSFPSLDEFLMSDSPFPLLFASFPSAKDPLYDGRTGGKPSSTCTLVSFAPWSWFKSWDNTKVKKRGEEYETLKKKMGMRLWEQLCNCMPKKFRENADIELMDVGTLLTTNHYLGATEGEIYGLDHSIKRFRPEPSASLRPDMGVEGLYLTGQDVASCGFVGAMVGGVICASAVTGYNLLIDSMRMAKKGFPGEKEKEQTNGVLTSK